MDYQSTRVSAPSFHGQDASHRIGMYAERHVLALVEKKGYTCLHHRLRTPFGELDLVCAKEAEIMFIEVKYRKSHHAVHYALSGRQRCRIFKAAQWVLGQSSCSSYTKSRIHMVLISNTTLTWYPDICLEGYDIS